MSMMSDRAYDDAYSHALSLETGYVREHEVMLSFALSMLNTDDLAALLARIVLDTNKSALARRMIAARLDKRMRRQRGAA